MLSQRHLDLLASERQSELLRAGGYERSVEASRLGVSGGERPGEPGVPALTPMFRTSSMPPRFAQRLLLLMSLVYRSL